MRYFSKQLNTGFSLVETLVAITILLVVIIGPLTITSSTVQSTSYASEQVIAFFLAQEGLELVQKVRDDQFLLYIEDSDANNTPWSDFLSDGTLSGCFEDPDTGDGCGLEMANDGSVDGAGGCSSNNDCLLRLEDPNTSTKRSLYTHTGTAGESEFSRQIFIEDLQTNPSETPQVKVTSIVTWRSGNLSQGQVVKLETYLLNTYAAN
jgi:type II secretory pathway pseudopilin PulG